MLKFHYLRFVNVYEMRKLFCKKIVFDSIVYRSISPYILYRLVQAQSLNTDFWQAIDLVIKKNIDIHGGKWELREQLLT